MTEIIMDILKSAVYGFIAIALCYLAGLIHRINPVRGRIDWQILSSKNPAKAVTSSGYFLSVIISLGGPISWASDSFAQGMADVLGFGIAALLLLNISMWLADKTYLKGLHLDNRINKGSISAGLIRLSHEISLGMVILGASWGDTGGIWVMCCFWLLGQILLAASIKFYFAIAKIDMPAQLDRNNTAAAISAAGIVLGLGLIAWESISGPFLGWLRGISESIIYYIAGALGIFVFRAIADLILLPGATFKNEILKKPQGNIPVASLDASLTIGISILLTWCLI